MIEESDIPDEIRKRFEDMMRIRESRRTQEEIILDLKSIIKDLHRETFIPYVLEMIIHIDQRNNSEAFKNLMSPMKQLTFLITLYFSCESTGNKDGFSEEEWMRITELLNEIEMTYFGDIGFFDEKSEQNIDFNKLSVSLQTFLNYFGNAQLSFDEQTLERFDRVCGAFDNDVKKLFGFGVYDAIKFCYHIKSIINRKLTDCNYYFLNQNEWPKLTAEFKKRGITDPRDWWDEPELKMLKEYRTNPGFILTHSLAELKKAPIQSEIIDKLIEFLCYRPNDVKKGIIYYADVNPFFDTPLIEINSNTYLCPLYKFLIESFYNRINASLIDVIGEKYSQFKNQLLEKKVIEIFRKLFGKDCQIFTSYYFDKSKAEQDILIHYKKFFLIIEVKDCLFRAPMRNPIKAYEKIKSDFKKAIQYGYDQCKRVEDKIAEGVPFKIYDHKTDKLLYEIIPNRIEDYFSIVVTQFKYGGIQTNLESLLIKDSDALYPWSVCVDDLESFVLLLKKLKGGFAGSQFMEFLKYREPYHDHLICSDELEMCGLFLNDRLGFQKCSDSDDMFTTFAGMTDIFDAEYRNGLGFDNELDQDVKKYYKVPEYSKDYTLNRFSGKDLIK